MFFMYEMLCLEFLTHSEAVPSPGQLFVSLHIYTLSFFPQLLMDTFM